jgi:hypothetical protein
LKVKEIRDLSSVLYFYKNVLYRLQDGSKVERKMRSEKDMKG